MQFRILITLLLVSICALRSFCQNIIELYPDSLGAPFSSIIHDFDIDTSNGTIWMLTGRDSVARWDGGQWQIYDLSGFSLFPYNPRKIRVDYVHNEVWVTTDRNVLSYSNGTWQKHSFTIYDSINDPINDFWYSGNTMEMNGGNVWLGTTCGIIKYDHSNWEYHAPEQYLTNVCNNILGTWFFASDIDFWNGNTWVVDYPNDSFYIWNDTVWDGWASPAFNIFQVEFNSTGELWLSNWECLDSCYVAKIDSNNQITYYRDSVYSGTAVAFDVFHMKIDRQDRVWVTGDGFVSYFDSIWHPYVYPGSSFSAIRFDGWGNTWVSVFRWGTPKTSAPMFLVFNPDGVQFPAITSSADMNYNAKQVSLYPNPSSGEITIEGLNDSKWDITLFDLTGKEVFNSILLSSTATFELDVNKGFYVVRISNGIENISRKLAIY